MLEESKATISHVRQTTLVEAVERLKVQIADAEGKDAPAEELTRAREILGKAEGILTLEGP